MALVRVHEIIRRRHALEIKTGRPHRSYVEYVYDDEKPNPDGSFDIVSAAFVSEGLPEDTEHAVHFGRKKDRLDRNVFVMKGNGRRSLDATGLKWAEREFARPNREAARKMGVVDAQGRGVVGNASYPRVKGLDRGRRL